VIFGLDVEQLEKVLDSRQDGKDIEQDDLRLFVERSLNYESKLLCLSYSLARLALRKKSSGPQIIKACYEMPGIFNMHIQECDRPFIKHMLTQESDQSLDLEAMLLDLAQRLAQYSH
jgi:hypothetical protein